MLLVEFPHEPGWPCVQVPRELLPHIGVLSDRPASEQSVELVDLGGVTSQMLSRLCQAIVEKRVAADDTAGLETLCALVRARLALELSGVPELDASLVRAIERALCALDDGALAHMAALAADAGGATAVWRPTETQALVSDPLYQARMHARAHVLAARLPAPAVHYCMAQMRAPHTSLEQLASELSLSSYMVKAVHDLVLGRHNDLQQLLYIVCPNAALTVINAAAYVGDTVLDRLSDGQLLKHLLRHAEAPLLKRVKRGELTKLEKDVLMVRQFLGWGMTRAGHAVYLYYRGPSARRPCDLSRADNWRPPPLDTLRFFHSRLGKDTDTLVATLCSTDIYAHRADETDSGGGGVGGVQKWPTLDVRHLAHRWAKRHGDKLARVRESEALLQGLQIL